MKQQLRGKQSPTPFTHTQYRVDPTFTQYDSSIDAEP